MNASAPGKIILFGEHAVVYDKLGISCAVNLRTQVKVKESDKGFITCDKFPEIEYNQEILKEIEEKYNPIIQNKEFSKLIQAPPHHSGLYLLSKIFKETGYKDLHIDITSNVLKNMGSSSALFSALTAALTTKSKDEIATLANQGDILAHGGTPSGIDAATCTHGGFLTFKKSKEKKKLNLKSHLPLIIIDTETPSQTSTTVNRVKTLRDKNKIKIDLILEEINQISTEAIDTIKEENYAHVGQLMNENQELLRQLQVSSEKIDTIINTLSKNPNIFGAKLTGGGGGGCIIALTKNQEEVIQNLKNKGIKSYKVNIDTEGVKRND